LMQSMGLGAIADQVVCAFSFECNCSWFGFAYD
jgi:hypothetical protein